MPASDHATFRSGYVRKRRTPQQVLRGERRHLRGEDDQVVDRGVGRP